MSELSPPLPASAAAPQPLREGLARARWTLARAYRRVGLPGALGAAALLAAGGVLLGGTLPAEHELRAVRERMQGLTERTRGADGAPRAAPLSTAQKLESFYAFFPPLAAVPDALDKLFAAAARNGLVLEQGDYRLVEDRDGKLGRYQITLPVKGNYLQVRQFVADVLREVPAAALDSVALKRETIATKVVEAQIKITLVIGGQ